MPWSSEVNFPPCEGASCEVVALSLVSDEVSTLLSVVVVSLTGVVPTFLSVSLAGCVAVASAG